MTEKTAMAEKSCVPCQGGMAPLTPDAAAGLFADLAGGWTMDAAAERLVLRLEFKGFAKAVYHANLAAWIADQEGHHPDVAFGWGYCEVTFTTHEAGGLTENDFICAAKFDRILAKA